MIEGVVVVVMPAYNAASTLEELPSIVGRKILVDDHSPGDTVRIARELGWKAILHRRTYGCGGNQKTCCRAALDSGADIIVMVHPGYQYNPTIVTAMAGMISSGVYDAVFGSRILGGGALRGGMPRYKYVVNRFLTAFENLLLGASSPNTTPDSADSAAKSWKGCRSSKIPTTSYSIIRC